MSAIQVMALADCCEIVSGATPSTSENAYWGGEICWATPKDLSDLEGHYISDTPRKLTKEGLSSCAATILPANSVLFSSRAPIGHVAINTVPMATNQGFKSFVPKPDLMNAKFLFHWLRFNRAYLESLGVGATFKEVSKAIVAKIKVPVPPLTEQRRIAAILDQADELRAKRREALAQYDELGQAIFIEMFGDPVTNPMGWPVIPFEELCSRVTVGIVVQPASYYRESGIPALRSLNIKPGRIVLNDLVYFSKEDNDTKLQKTKLRAGDVVLVRSGQPGTASVVPPELDGVNAIDLLIASPRSTEVDSTYLCEFFNSNAGRSLVLSSQRGQIQKHLNVGSLNAAPIVLPPLTLQRQFAQRLASTKALAARLGESSDEMDSLFASLQHRAFHGEL